MKHKARVFPQGEALFGEGDPADSVMVIVRGRIALQRHLDGMEKTIAYLGAGEILGEAAIFNRHRHSVTAKAMEETEVLSMDPEEARKQFERAPQFIRKMVASLSDRLRHAYEFPEGAGASGRHAHLLNGWGGDGVELPYAIRIEAATPAVGEQLPGGIDAEILPFTVSNARDSGKAIFNRNSLKLSLPACGEFSSPHFELIYRHDRICVRDLGGRGRHPGQWQEDQPL